MASVARSRDRNMKDYYSRELKGNPTWCLIIIIIIKSDWLITSVLAWKQQMKCEKVSPHVLFLQGIRTGRFQSTTENLTPFYINLY